MTSILRVYRSFAELINDMQVFKDAWAKVDDHVARQGMRTGAIWESHWWTDGGDE